ncbi:MICOS complex subunit Mic60 [Pseudolycoriella hygida]|uniref:MICOS complex subunit MIC60 n=1 Tax=Pseudolycoriella hygida TaxID=35572 RepID=A0A9Q0RYK2_9DIPT|nr:MICOS complex subunit Mic60 [Pseudolycoriella hygida]
MIRIAFRSTLTNKNQNLLPVLKRHQNRRSIGTGLPPLQQAGLGKVIVILSPFAVIGGVSAYAKYDEKFRKTLVSNVPGSETILKILLQEDGNAIDEASKSIGRATQKVSDFSSSVTGYFGGNKTDEPVPVKPKEKEAVKSTKTPASDLATPPLPKVSAPVPTAKPAVNDKIEAKQVAAPPKAAPVPPAKPQELPSNITELEKSVEKHAQVAVNEYNKAVKILKSYNEDVKKIVDEAVEKLDMTAWTSLKNKTSARDFAVEKAETAAQAARETIRTLELSIGSIAKDTPVDVVEKLRNKIRSLSDHLNTSKEEMYVAKNSAKSSEQFWKKIEAARNYFIEEIESLFPGVNLKDNELNLSKDNLDLFIIYAHSHLLNYQKELQKLQDEGETRLKRALDALRGDDNIESIRSQLEYYLEKEKQALNIANQKKLLQIKADADKAFREHLKKQSEAHADHLSDAVAQREAELKRVFNRELSEKLSTEQAAYKEHLAAMLGKLKGIDAALKARADADRMVHQAQSLWSACQALWASVKSGEPGTPWQLKLRPLASEVSSISKAAEGDELVTVVLKGVPEKARTRGVYPEDALRERFVKVEKLARQLALVPAEGARLPIYLLSFIQAIFIIRPSNPITEAELNDEPIDFSQFDTYDILNRAKYWIERGNLTQALKYMNLLKGASRNIAEDWLKETRLLLETQQAANTLMAHAATSGLSFL